MGRVEASSPENHYLNSKDDMFRNAALSTSSKSPLLPFADICQWLDARKSYHGQPSDKDRWNYFGWLKENIQPHKITSPRRRRFSESDIFEISTELGLMDERKDYFGAFTKFKANYAIPAYDTASTFRPDETGEKMKSEDGTQQPKSSSSHQECTKNNMNQEDPLWLLLDSYIKYICADLKINSVPIVKEFPSHKLHPDEKDYLRVRRIDPWPNGNAGLYKGWPIFEREDDINLYEMRLSEIQIFYEKSLQGRGNFPSKMLRAGMYVMFKHNAAYRGCGVNLKFRYERAQVVTVFSPGDHDVDNRQGGITYYRLYLLDQGTTTFANAAQLYFLFDEFSYPPRVLHLKLVGLKRYYFQATGFQGLLSYRSGIWSGSLTAYKHGKFGFILFSSLVTMQSYQYGISEYILRRISVEDQIKVGTGDLLQGKIVGDDENGGFWFQIKTSFLRHLMDIQTSKCRSWKKENPEPYLKRGTIIMVPDKNKKFQRARVEKVITTEDKVHVFFMDNGNESTVSINNICLARNFHPAYEFLPQTVVRMKLANSPTDGNRNEYFATLCKFVEGVESYYMKICGRNDSATLVEIVKPVDIPKYTKNGFDLAVAHFTLDGSCESGQGRLIPANPPLSLTTVYHIGTAFSQSIRFDYAEPNFDDGMHSIFLRPGECTKFRIARVDNKSETVMLHPAVLCSELTALEKDLERCYSNVFYDTAHLRAKYLKPGFCFSVRSQILKKCVRAQVVARRRDILDVILVDYGIPETLYRFESRRLSWDQCQLPACGVRAALIMYEENITSSSEIPTDKIQELAIKDITFLGFAINDITFLGRVDKQVDVGDLRVWRIQILEFNPPPAPPPFLAPRGGNDDGEII